jgi:hypothetical protein
MSPVTSTRPARPISVLETPSIFADIAPTLERLRAAVRSALDTRPKARVGARSCAREFGFDKSIGWKIFQIGYTDDFVSVLSAMPGARGWEIVLAKFAAAGVHESTITELRAVLALLEKQLAGRRIDRSTLSGMAAASVEGDESRRQVLRIRKQASDAMAVIYGVHARARVGAYLCMPSRSTGSAAGMVDIAACTVIEGLERRRPGAPWMLFDPIWSYDGSGNRIRSVGGGLAEGGGVLIPELSSSMISGDEIAERDDRPSSFEFRARDPRREGPLNVCFGEYAEAVGPACKQGAEKIAEFSLPLSVPTPTAVLDILMHRDLPRTGDLQAELYASGVAVSANPRSRDRLRLPLEARVGTPTSLHISDLGPEANASYIEVCRRGAAKFGFDLSAFEVHRVVVPHPPVPCTVTMWWELGQS